MSDPGGASHITSSSAYFWYVLFPFFDLHPRTFDMFWRIIWNTPWLPSAGSIKVSLTTTAGCSVSPSILRFLTTVSDPGGAITSSSAWYVLLIFDCCFACCDECVYNESHLERKPWNWFPRTFVCLQLHRQQAISSIIPFRRRHLGRRVLSIILGSFIKSYELYVCLFLYAEIP